LCRSECQANAPSSLDLPPKAVQIILSEMDTNDYAFSGKFVADQDDPYGEKNKS